MSQLFINIKHLIKLCGILVLGFSIFSPAIADTIPDFTKFEAGTERKKEFFNYLLPLINNHNAATLKAREKISKWSQHHDNIGWIDHFQLENFLEVYQLDNFDTNDEKDWATLLRRVDVIPASLALAQAANESGWGTSRFAREGNNYYGQWCFKRGCGMVPNDRGTGDIHEVAVFNSPSDSIASYLRNINSHKAYKSLRKIRMSLRAAAKPVTGNELAKGLDKYSQRGQDYIKEIRSIIRHNNLQKYDYNYNNDSREYSPLFSH
jgi:Bax protein|tara:strand:- start:68 stop:859 length:792 start_codon:yes stop_codon:yes gene_type:complete